MHKLVSPYLLLLSTLSHLTQASPLPNEDGQQEAQQLTSCSHDPAVHSLVTAWPGDSCDLGEHPVSIAAYDTPSPLSCPPAGPESWCYPIWENEQSTSGVKLELRSADEKYKSEPIRRFPKQHEMPGFKARSVTLEWPGEAMHAVFYPGEDCPDVSKGRPGVTWHVERGRKTSNSCESPPAGLFKSVRFMKREEYDEFSRAMRQEGGGSDRALSR